MGDLIKKYCYIIMPIFTVLFIDLIKGNIYIESINNLIYIAILLAIMLLINLNLYATFTNSSVVIKNLEKTEHQKIFINNINFGLGCFIICIISWLFEMEGIAIKVILMMGTNVIITIYYILIIANYIKRRDK